MMDPVVILAARRTAIGSFQGQFQGLSAPLLGAAAIRAALLDTPVHASEVDEVLMGCCLMAGIGQAPARQALMAAGLPDSVPATTLTKMCGSGMKTVMLGHDQLLAGAVGVVVAGGMESMTHAPYLLPSARAGQRLGHGQMVDHMFFDGLQDAYDGQLMGVHAEATAKELGFTRAEQDAYALASVQRAQAAVAGGLFAAEIAPVTMKVKGEERALDIDETPGQCKPEKIATLKPAFGADGTVTAASSASISDGAAALVLARDSTARSRDWQPIARIVGHSTHAGPPGRFTTAPVGAIKRLFDLTGWTDEDVDLYEINEAFAVVTLIAMRELGLSHDKVNVRGGACALGHPIGASGARIMVTLIHALKARGLTKGLATLCIGGGEATAVALELV